MLKDQLCCLNKGEGWLEREREMERR